MSWAGTGIFIFTFYRRNASTLSLSLSLPLSLPSLYGGRSPAVYIVVGITAVESIIEDLITCPNPCPCPCSCSCSCSLCDHTRGQRASPVVLNRLRIRATPAAIAIALSTIAVVVIEPTASTEKALDPPARGSRCPAMQCTIPLLFPLHLVDPQETIPRGNTGQDMPLGAVAHQETKGFRCGQRRTGDQTTGTVLAIRNRNYACFPLFPWFRFACPSYRIGAGASACDWDGSPLAR